MTRTRSISGTVLVVAPSVTTQAPAAAAELERGGLAVERAAGPDAAIARVEAGEAPDVVLLTEQLADPVRVAQRLHSLDRLGAVVVLAEPGAEQELRHALAVAPFLDGDVSLHEPGEPLVASLAAAAARTRARRDTAAAQKKRRETPPPLSARYLGTLLDSAPIGIVTLDAARSVIGWNKRAGEMLGVPEVEALGSRFAELFAADAGRLDALIDEFGAAGLDLAGQVFERAGRSFEITGARFAIGSGEEGALLILQDVTKRRAAEREVELQRALLEAQADSSVVGIAVVAPDGTVQRMNKAWQQMWGVDAEMLREDRERATQMMLDQCLDPRGFMAGIERLAASGGGEYFDEVTLKDGRVIERYAAHVRGEAGHVIGRIWFHTDITAHRREEDALRFLADATNLLSSSLDYQTTLRHIAELAVPRLAEHCRVAIREASHRQSEATAGVQPATPGPPLEVPIEVRDRRFGTIRLVRARTHPFDDGHLKLAEELARRAAIAIDNSRVHAELRQTARTLQESLLPPHLPAVHGMDLAARFRPAGAGMQVGGDFYDIFEVAPGRWAITLGDVCGKGAEAAAVTALTRYTVRTAAMYETDVRGVLRMLNQALLRQRADYRFTTLVFCVVDLEGDRKTLHVACGGHPKPLLRRPDGRVEAVGAPGPLLGVFPDAEFREDEVALEDGDVLVLYTDGLTDALAPEQMVDERTLLDALAGCGGMTAAEVAFRIEDTALAGDRDRVPRDDIALVVAKLGDS